MSVRISVRLPDRLVDDLDAALKSGAERSRASFIERSLQRELRGRKSMRDIEILRQAEGVPYPDLDGMVEYIADTEQNPSHF